MPQITDPSITGLFGGGQPAQQAAPTIYRTQPKQVAPQRPAEAQGDALSNQQKQQSLAEGPLDIQKKQLDIQEKQQKLDAGPTAQASEGERKNAAFFRRAIGANEVYNSLNIGPRSYVGDAVQSTAPGILNQLPSVIGNSSARQQADAAELEFVSAVLRSDSGAAIPENEIATAINLYFPQPGDGVAVIEQKKEARQRAIDGLTSSAGRLAGDAASGSKPLTVDVPSGPQTGTPGEKVERYGVIVGFYGPDGNLVEIDTGSYFDADGNPISADQLNANAEKQISDGADRLDELLGQGGITDRMKRGLTLGFGDEISGLSGGMIEAIKGGNFGGGYVQSRDIARERQRRIDERTGWAGDVAEIGGSLFLPGGVIKSVGSAAKVGAAYGAAGGFGYGEGARGSTLNALVGAAAGGTIGAAGQKIGNALAAKSTNKAGLSNRVNALATAGKAENVTVNRAMANPALENKVTGAQATLTGGPIVDRALGKVNSEIEAGVKRLGRDGTGLDEVTGGNVITNAAQRNIDKTGKAAAVKYGRAEKLAGSAKIAPKEATSTVEAAIKELSETPNTNSAEIKFLDGLKEDFAKDISVGGLRRMRTTLRKKIARGELVFGESEARVLSVMDAAANDIRAGLTAQGKPAAAKAFDAADKSYRARMEYINGTLQKVIGKRNSNLSSEGVFKKFMAMAKPGGDSQGLLRFYATLSPEEAADVSATFADSLGKNNKGKFTTAQFLNHVEKMPKQVRETVFGVEGSKSIDNLVMLATEHNRVYGQLNHSRSGVATAARDYRQWLGGALGIGGTIAGGGASSAVGGAAIAAGALVKDAVSANLLMSPRISKWILSAPKTTRKAAIDKHFAQLGNIAKAEPALASEINILRDAIFKAANDNTGRAAAQDSENKNR